MLHRRTEVTSSSLFFGRYPHRVLLRSIRSLGALPVLALLVTSTGCGSGTATGSPGSPGGSVTPNGELTLSGVIAGTLTAGTQASTSGCRVLSSTPPPPATTPISVTLLGTVDFGSGSSAVVMGFGGGPESWTLPFPGESKGSGPPGFVDITGNAAEWRVGQGIGSGTVALARSGSGTIHGSVDAILAPVRGSSSQLHVAGSWSC